MCPLLRSSLLLLQPERVGGAVAAAAAAPAATVDVAVSAEGVHKVNC